MHGTGMCAGRYIDIHPWQTLPIQHKFNLSASTESIPSSNHICTY